MMGREDPQIHVGIDPDIENPSLTVLAAMASQQSGYILLLCAEFEPEPRKTPGFFGCQGTQGTHKPT